MKTFEQLKKIKRGTSYVALILIIMIIVSTILYNKYNTKEIIISLVIQLILFITTIVVKLVISANTYKVICDEITSIVGEYVDKEVYICCTISETPGYTLLDVYATYNFEFYEEKYIKCQTRIKSYLDEVEKELKKSFVLTINDNNDN